MATFTPRKYSWYSFLLQAEQNPGPEGGWKDYVNDTHRIEPVTFQVAAQHLNLMCHRTPLQLHSVGTNVGQASFCWLVTHKKYCINSPNHCAGTVTLIHSYGIKHQKCTKERC